MWRGGIRNFPQCDLGQEYAIRAGDDLLYKIQVDTLFLYAAFVGTLGAT
jgi:hypothetical protein